MREPPDVELSLTTEQACFIVVKAREFDVKEEPSGMESGSNASDDKMVGVLEDRRNDSVRLELTSFIAALDVDQQIDLVALAWVGRGDYDISEWQAARKEAAAAHNGRTATYLLGMPLLGDYVEEALAATGRSCRDEEMGRL